MTRRLQVGCIALIALGASALWTGCGSDDADSDQTAGSGGNAGTSTGGSSSGGANAGGTAGSQSGGSAGQATGGSAQGGSSQGGSAGSAGTTQTCPGPVGQDAAQYDLVFRDEFETGALDTGVWIDHIWYDQSDPVINYAVEDGALKIWPDEGFVNRTITTDGTYTQTYGYFEMEAKLPIGKGTWPAFWLISHETEARPEMDIMEAYAGGGPESGWSDANFHPTAYGATVWIDQGQQGGSKTIQTPDLSADFHVYGVKWEPDKQTYYFDGQEQLVVDVSMDAKMFILLDLWFGSASGDPDDTTPKGKGNSYEVKYVRAWQFGSGQCL